MISREERVGSWMKSIFPMPDTDPVRNYSLNFRRQKEENLAWDSQRLASRRLVRPVFQVIPASRKLVRAPSAFLTAKRLFTQRTIPTTKRKWKVIFANSSYGGVLSKAVSKMVTRLVRHYDQDERQSDVTSSVLVKAFAKHGARDFSDEQWLRLLHEGCSKTRFEYCEDSKTSFNSKTLWWNIN